MCQAALRQVLATVGLAAILATPVAWVEAAAAQDAPPVRVRGTIERLDGAMYVVKARDGTELKITAAEKPQIAGIVKASLSDIKKGSFVGVTAMPQADGSLTAAKHSYYARRGARRRVGRTACTASSGLCSHHPLDQCSGHPGDDRFGLRDL